MSLQQLLSNKISRIQGGRASKHDILNWKGFNRHQYALMCNLDPDSLKKKSKSPLQKPIEESNSDISGSEEN
jgi:hypothetical protein